VRTEIQEHYESAREEAASRGASVDEADRLAVAALGDAKAANCQYRNVLLTSAEARVLRDARWEARAFCSRPWLKWLLVAMPVVALLAATISFRAGASAIARVLLVGGVGMGLWFTLPFLPVYTPSRGRIVRCVKWVVLVATLGLAFGSDALRWSWLLFSCLWPLAWIEWTRVSVRRKLPVAEWPKALYL
jgi:hypothetical protein